MINWVTSKRAASSRLRASYDIAAKAVTSLFPGYLKTLAGLSPHHEHGTPAARRSHRLDDFPNIVQGIYQVRCNLFHGGKRAGDSRDEKLVRISARILEKWVGNLVGSWRSAS